MGASPVIIDDGGSTRIKRELPPPGIGEMDTLLTVDENHVPPQSLAEAPGNFTKVKITYVEKDGEPRKFLDSPLLPNDNFTVVSNNGQQLTLLINGAVNCKIAVQGKPNNVPCVEAKQFKKKRRYVVANAGSIRTIDGVANGAPIPRFDAAVVGSVYTTIVLS